MVSMFESIQDVAEHSVGFVVGEAPHAPQDVTHACLPARIERPRDDPLFVPDETYREPLNLEASRRSFGECTTHESFRYTRKK